jgi:FkbH-like protein
MQSNPSENSLGAARPAVVDPALFAQHNGSRYRAPVDLQVTPDAPLRFLVVGACLAEAFPPVAALINGDFRGEFLLLNNFDSFPEIPPERAAEYDFQILHLPLRSILGNAFFRLSDDGSRHEEFLRETQECVARYLTNILRLNSERKLLTFVLGFLVPQQNPLGRFQPRYDLRNVVHFVERLNQSLAAEVGRRENVHFVDADQIAAGIGKKNCQDDMVWSFTHGTTLSDGDHDHDLNRIEPPAPMQEHYAARWLEFFEAVIHEVVAMHRTLQQQDTVKLVAVDLDDTLWRGVAAEGTLGALEGWPMGLMETLLFLKKRGILLAIVSKNDEAYITSNWPQIVQGQIAWSDFAIRKINFRSKVENLAEILQEVNLRPQNAVMIDDNPVERAAIAAGLPGVRVLGRHPYYLKRILLWSAETQRSVITQEASDKTEMVRGQLTREAVRRQHSHDEFLQSLDLQVKISAVTSTKDVQMNRTLELFNKTNQFNTTGQRYTLEQCHQALVSGRRLFVVQAEDRFTQYGLIAAAWLRDNCIEHLVMSCRALGLGIEDALLAHIAHELAQQRATAMFGRLRVTEANFACRSFYRRNGFAPVDHDPQLWSLALALPFPMPAHVCFGARGAAA